MILCVPCNKRMPSCCCHEHKGWQSSKVLARITLPVHDMRQRFFLESQQNTFPIQSTSPVFFFRRIPGLESSSQHPSMPPNNSRIPGIAEIAQCNSRIRVTSRLLTPRLGYASPPFLDRFVYPLTLCQGSFRKRTSVTICKKLVLGILEYNFTSSWNIIIIIPFLQPSS